jgi:hypothetical protein
MKNVQNIYSLMTDGTIYQFTVLLSLIMFQAIFMIVSGGQINEFVMGAIISLAVSLPITAKSKEEK